MKIDRRRLTFYQLLRLFFYLSTRIPVTNHIMHTYFLTNFHEFKKTSMATLALRDIACFPCRVTVGFTKLLRKYSKFLSKVYKFVVKFKVHIEIQVCKQTNNTTN